MKSILLTPLESTALRLYRAREINIEEYDEMVELKPVKVAKSKDFSASQEQYTPPEPIDDDKMAPEEIDVYIGSEPPPPAEPPRKSDWILPSPKIYPIKNI